MIQSFINIFRVPELRNKVLFTLFLLAIYRIGYHVPLPGTDQTRFEEIQQQQAQSSRQNDAATRLASYVSIFSGGNLSQSTIFGLGVMPYISASIIFQLLITVVPTLEKLRKEGETGRRKIQEYTRYATIPLAIIQASFWVSYMHSQGLVMSSFDPAANFEGTFAFWFGSVTALTAGCLFLMWLGEQIDEYGLGNGISLIIMAGIVSQMPSAIVSVVNPPTGEINPGQIIFLLCSFVFVVAGAILMTQAQRRIPIQQAKHTRGRKVFGGQKNYLPLRVNHGGVMPIIFAQSLMLFPGILFSTLDGMINAGGINTWFGQFIHFLNIELGRGAYIYLICEVILIYFFAYFWTTVQFQPKEMANQLRDYGSFVLGIRPGKRTADYLEKVMRRITFVGAGFLCVVAIVPTIVAVEFDVPFQAAAFLGGTGLLIVVSVSLDLVQRIEANLMMRNYSGFLGTDGGNKGKRIKGRNP